MIQIDKEAERQKSMIERNKVAMERNIIPKVEECEEDSLSSSMSMYNLDSSEEESKFLSNWTPTIFIDNAPLSMHVEEVHSSPITEKVPSERNSMAQEEDHPSSYNTEEIFGAFSFNLHRKQGSQKRVRKVKQNDGTLEEMQEYEVLFEKTNEDHVTVATTSTTLTEATADNITILNENIFETE